MGWFRPTNTIGQSLSHSGSKEEQLSAKPSRNQFVQTAVVHWGAGHNQLGPSNDRLMDWLNASSWGVPLCYRN